MQNFCSIFIDSDKDLHNLLLIFKSEQCCIRFRKLVILYQSPQYALGKYFTGKVILYLVLLAKFYLQREINVLLRV